MRRLGLLVVVMLAGCAKPADPQDDRFAPGQEVVFVNLDSMPADVDDIGVRLEKDYELANVEAGVRGVVINDLRTQQPLPAGRGSRNVPVRVIEGRHAGKIVLVTRVFLRPTPKK